jgi:hypothetical protein
MLATFAPLPSAADGDAESLRAAVIAAGNNGDASDEIHLAAGAYVLTLANVAGQENFAADGDLDLRFDPAAPAGESQTILIQGAGAEQTIIDGAALGDRVFQVLGGVTVIFRDLTITGGAAVDDGQALRLPAQSDSLGGGILMRPVDGDTVGGRVELHNVRIVENSAVGATGRNGAGGGVYLLGGTLEASNSAISQNVVRGGANGGGAKGGGIYAGRDASDSMPALTLTGSTLEANRAEGGVGRTATFHGSEGGQGGAAAGGGVFLDRGSFTLTASTISGNRALGGAGGRGADETVWNDGDYSYYTAGRGGRGGAAAGAGIYLDASSFTMTDSLMSANDARGGGGGRGGDIYGSNTGVFGSGGHGGRADGGALFVANGAATIATSTISENIARGGDGDDGVWTIFHVAGDGGWGGAGSGGGVFLAQGSLTVMCSTISANAAVGGDGGSGGWTVSNSSGGSGAPGGDALGGGLTAAATASLSILNATVSSNTASGGSGGNGGQGDSLSVDSAFGEPGWGGFAGGGGLWLGADAVAALASATIAANAGAGGPGGEGGSPGYPPFQYGIAPAYGGGVFKEDGASPAPLDLQNTLLGDNSAQTGRDLYGTVSFANASLFETAPTGGVAVSGATPNLIGLDPKLAPLADNGGPTPTHALLPGSPALDAGLGTGSAGQDQRGFHRPVNLAGVANATGGDGSDIGAYERQAPLAADDVATVEEDASVVIDVLANDDPGLVVISVSDPAHGTAVINSDGTITYLPDADYHGHDAFIYTAVDALGGTVAAGVFVTVEPVNDPPVAMPDSAATNEDEAVVIDVIANDSDVEGDLLTIIATTDPENGSIVLGEGGAITYTPNANYYGVDAFSYTVSDGNGGESTATVSVTVNPVNDAPTAIVLSSAAVDENVLGAAVGEVTVIDPDPDDTHQLTVSDDRFEIVGGTLKLKDGVYLDFESEAIVTLEISAADSGSPPATLTQEFIIAVNDVFEPLHPWQNQEMECDVNGDGLVSVADLLEIVMALRVHDEPVWELPLEFPPGEGPPPYLDVDGDNRVTLADLLAVVHQMREGLGDPAPAESEFDSRFDSDDDNLSSLASSDAFDLLNHRYRYKSLAAIELRASIEALDAVFAQS